jgi:Uncharacterised nucleotidyltransferase
MPSSLGEVRAAIVDLVVGDEDHASRAAARLTEIGGWDAALPQAARWGVLALLHARLNDATAPPAGVLATLRAESLRGVLRSRAVVERSVEVLQLFEAAGIEAIAIKGVGAIGTLGARAAARTTNDLDVVVRERDAAPARALLRDRGFREVDPPFDRHMSDIARSRQLHNVARTLRKDNFEVDLHWRFGPQPPAALAPELLVARAGTVTVGAATFRAAHPVDAVLIAVHHALRSGFVPENSVRDLCDLAAWWEDGRATAALDELIDAASRSGMATSLLALWGTVLRRAPHHPLRAGYDRLAATLGARASAEAALLERHFEHTLRHGNPARFTLEVFAPRVYARWLAGALSQTFRPAPAGEHGGESPPERRPLALRLANIVPRCWRIVRELAHVEHLRSYRAVARAQSRFH